MRIETQRNGYRSVEGIEDFCTSIKGKLIHTMLTKMQQRQKYDNDTEK